MDMTSIAGAGGSGESRRNINSRKQEDAFGSGGEMTSESMVSMDMTTTAGGPVRFDLSRNTGNYGDSTRPSGSSMDMTSTAGSSLRRAKRNSSGGAYDRREDTLMGLWLWI